MLFTAIKMSEQSKLNKEILERMPAWFLILRQAYEEYHDKDKIGGKNNECLLEEI